LLRKQPPVDYELKLAEEENGYSSDRLLGEDLR
jgi:hypothetical protein